MPIYKRCPQCGKRIPEGTKCECISKRHKEYDCSRDKDIYNFYRSRQWGTLSKYMRLRFQNLDVYELIVNNAVVPGEVIHHIFPVDEYWNERFNTEKMIMLSESNHRKFHALMKTDRKQEVMDLLIKCVDDYKKQYGFD